MCEQPFRGVLRKRCSGNMQQIYGRTPILKCDLNKVVLQFYWNCTSAWLFSCKFPTYFQNTFSKNTSGWLLFGFIYIRNLLSFLFSFLYKHFSCVYFFLKNSFFKTATSKYVLLKNHFLESWIAKSEILSRQILVILVIFHCNMTLIPVRE